MKKNLVPQCALLFALALSLQSCRTGEDYLSAKEEQYYSNKFQVFTSFNNERVNYAKGFKTLLENYDGIHKTHYTRASVVKSGNLGRSDEEYVEFRLHSQSMLLENDERWIIYPIVKNGQVSGLMAGILRNEETEVEFRKLDSGNDYYDKVLKIFSMAYIKNNLKNGLSHKGGGCGFVEDDACGIPDIILNPPRPKTGGGGTGSSSGGPKGGCNGFNNCINPGGGGGGGGGIEDPTPCWLATSNNLLAKNLLNKDKIKDETKNLTSTLSSDTNEKAFSFGKDSSGNDQTTPIKTGTGGAMAPFPVTTPSMTITGAAHTHTADLYTAFSAGDFYLFSSAHATNPDFNVYYVFGADGSVYALTITNPTDFANFLTNYPKGTYFDPSTNGWASSSTIGADFENIKTQFSSLGFSVDEAYENATAAVASKYKMGMSVSKQDSSGNFNSIFVKEKYNFTNIAGITVPLKAYEKTPDCNL